jgi:hypothetical protein
MRPEEFEPTVSAGERLQTYALDRTATETSCGKYFPVNTHGKDLVSGVYRNMFTDQRCPVTEKRFTSYIDFLYLKKETLPATEKY